MPRVSRWELWGVPASLVFSALYELGVLSALGLSEHHIPHLMVLGYVVAAAVRSRLDKQSKAAKAATQEETENA